jgi:TonB-dependent starch-binding outer membrane protein SusC
MKLFNAKRIAIRLLCLLGLITVFLTSSKAVGLVSFSNQGISINVRNESVSKVFDLIGSKAGYKFFYDESILKDVIPVTLKIDNENIDKVLDEISRQTNLSFKHIDRTISVNKKLTEKRVFTEKQQLKISGKVTDESGAPMPGVNVTVKGSSTGVITDAEGFYTIPVSGSTDVLLFTFVGYLTEERSVGNADHIDLVITPDIVKINEVVVIGYGETKKKDLSTAISTVSNIEMLKNQPNTVAGMLQGNVAGVTVMNNGGDPGVDPQIVIRGLGSPNDKPLWVVDGVPGAPVNKEDIETITILKDAASAAIYGSNVGSGGVIIVTTKKAKAGKTKVEANLYTGIQNAWKLPKALNAQEMADVKNLAADNAGTTRLDAFNAALNPWGMVTRTNWINEIFRTAHLSHFGVSLSGGSDNLKALASVEGNDREGTLLNTFSKDLSGKLNVDFNISKKIQFSQWFQAKTSRGYSANTTSGYTGAVISAIYMPPAATVYDADGNFGGVVPDSLITKYAGSYGDIVNPVATLLRTNIYNPQTRLHSSSSLTIKPVDWITFKSVYTIGGYDNVYQDFVVKRTEPGKINLQNSRTLSNTSGYNWLWENTVNINQKFGDHSLSVLGGYSASYLKDIGFGVTGYGFDHEDSWAQNMVNASDWTKTQPWESKNEESSDSWFGRLSYIYNDRYFVNASIRHDASSKLYYKNNDGYFPSVAAAWKISSEPFFHLDGINLMKLRASWGQIGDVNSVPNYSYNVKLTTSQNTVLGQTPAVYSGVGLQSIPNLKLTWETSEMSDVGADLEFFNSKLSLTADYYIKYTKNLIDKIPTPSTSGVMEEPYGNIGKVKNQGFELALNYNDRINNDLSYHLGANMSTLKSTVENLGTRTLYQNTDVDVRGVLTPVYQGVGQPWNSYYLIQTDGIFKTDQEAAAYVDSKGSRIQPNAKAGDLKFIDRNGDGIINDDDRKFMGSQLPKITYGLNMGINYKNFDFAMQWQGVYGTKIFNAFKSTTLTASEQGYNMSRDILKAWSSSNMNSNIPVISATDLNKNFQTTSDWFLEDGSYLRLKNITIGYTLPASVFNKLGIDDTKLRFYATAENLLTFTKYKGMDPEVGNYGVDVGKYPVSRTFILGLNLNF